MNKLLSTYGLTREPFTKDVAPSDMFQTEQLQEALQALKAAIEGRTSPRDATASTTRTTPPSTAATSTARSRSGWDWSRTPALPRFIAASASTSRNWPASTSSAS